MEEGGWRKKDGGWRMEKWGMAIRMWREGRGEEEKEEGEVRGRQREEAEEGVAHTRSYVCGGQEEEKREREREGGVGGWRNGGRMEKWVMEDGGWV
jgi:hypothetical protein